MKGYHTMNNPASHGQSRLFFNAPIDKLLLTLREEFVIQEIMRLHESEGEPYLSVGMDTSRAEGASITQVPTRIRLLVALHDPRTRQPLGDERQAAILNVRPLSDTRTVLDSYCMEEWFEPYLNGLLATLCNMFVGMVEGDIPKEPETEETRQETEQATPTKALPSPDKDGWTAVFDYYRANRERYESLSQFAAAIGYSYGTVRNQHAIYKAGKK